MHFLLQCYSVFHREPLCKSKTLMPMAQQKSVNRSNRYAPISIFNDENWRFYLRKNNLIITCHVVYRKLQCTKGSGCSFCNFGNTDFTWQTTKSTESAINGSWGPSWIPVKTYRLSKKEGVQLTLHEAIPPLGKFGISGKRMPKRYKW